MKLHQLAVFSLIAAAAFGCADGDVQAQIDRSTAQMEKSAQASFPQYEALFQALDANIAREMEDNHIPGVALVVVHDGRTIYKRGYGIADAETGAPVDPETTIFRIGSTSKALTLLALTRLIDDGRLNRSDDVSDYFTEIENRAGAVRPITIENLLTHTTGFDQIGLGRQLGGFEYSIAQRQAARPSLSAFLADGNLRRIEEPGRMFRYDTYGPTLAAVIIERVTGKSFPDAMRQEMFEPLGMTRSSVEVRPEDESDLAKGHGYVDGSFVTTPYEIYMTTPASSIDATVADMGRLLEALTGDGANSAGRFLSAEMQEHILRPQYRPRKDFAGMSHGLWESLSEGRGKTGVPVRTLGHGGDMWGFNGSMTVIPELDLAFYVVANRNGEGGGPNVKIGRPVMQAIQQTFYPDRTARPVPIPQRDAAVDLSEYAGSYYWGVFCHTCSPEEFELGGWRRPNAIGVTPDKGALKVGSTTFLRIEGDLFVDEHGFDQIFFKRDATGQISSFSYQEDPTAYEKERSD